VCTIASRDFFAIMKAFNGGMWFERVRDFEKFRDASKQKLNLSHLDGSTGGNGKNPLELVSRLPTLIVCHF
jgi:hypothetical protein